MGSTKKCFKHTLLFGNLAVLIIGALLIGFGAYTLKKGVATNELSVTSSQISIGFVVIGSLVVVLSFLGCCGAWIESRFLLGIFLLLLFLLMLAEFGIAIGAYVRRNEMDDILKDAWEGSSVETKKDIEKNFECCGWIDPREVERNCTAPNNNQVCSDKVIDSVKSGLLAMGILGIIVAIMQIFALCFGGCFLCCCMKRSTDDDEESFLLKPRNPKFEKTREDVHNLHGYYRQKYQGMT